MTNATQPQCSATSTVPVFDVVIVGAGIAGCLAAKLLKEQGLSVGVIEKSRGTGGRAGSKRLEETSVDLGATSFHMNSDELIELKRELIQNRVIAEWQSIQGLTTHTSASSQANEQQQNSVEYVGIPRSSAITRYLLGDASIITSAKAHHLSKDADLWQIRDDKYQLIARGQKLIVTAPPAQTAMLLATQTGTHEQLLLANDAIAYTQSCWAVWVETEEPQESLSLESRHLKRDKHSIIAKLVPEFLKPERQQGKWIWSVQSQCDWANQTLDQTKEEIAKHLIDAFEAETEVKAVRWGQPHRWLLGQQEGVVDNTQRAWNQDLQLGIAGDWLYAGNVQGAMISAQRLVQKMIA